MEGSKQSGYARLHSMDMYIRVYGHVRTYVCMYSTQCVCTYVTTTTHKWPTFVRTINLMTTVSSTR